MAVEDEPLILLETERALRMPGCEIIDPVGTLAKRWPHRATGR